jgi:5-methyltetrahydrofolate--homocysteine methyltransferase
LSTPRVSGDDYDGLLDLARTQAEDGAHCLDVCVATTERSDEKQFMLNLVKRLSLEIDAPLVIDSTDPEVIESAVTQIPGRPIINSINLEGDGSRFEKLAPKIWITCHCIMYWTKRHGKDTTRKS